MKPEDGMCHYPIMELVKRRKNMDKEKIKNFVKKRYGKMAKAGSSCCPSCESGASLMELGKRIGYSDEDLRNVPEASNIGLGCGNPVALAALKDVACSINNNVVFSTTMESLMLPVNV